MERKYNNRIEMSTLNQFGNVRFLNLKFHGEGKEAGEKKKMDAGNTKQGRLGRN